MKRYVLQYLTVSKLLQLIYREALWWSITRMRQMCPEIGLLYVERWRLWDWLVFLPVLISTCLLTQSLKKFYMDFHEMLERGASWYMEQSFRSWHYPPKLVLCTYKLYMQAVHRLAIALWLLCRLTRVSPSEEVNDFVEATFTTRMSFLMALNAFRLERRLALIGVNYTISRLLDIQAVMVHFVGFKEMYPNTKFIWSSNNLKGHGHMKLWNLVRLSELWWNSWADWVNFLVYWWGCIMLEGVWLPKMRVVFPISLRETLWLICCGEVAVGKPTVWVGNHKQWLITQCCGVCLSHYTELLYWLFVIVKVMLTNLKPDTVYRIRVAAATESIVYPGRYFIGPYASDEEIRTLGELV